MPFEIDSKAAQLSGFAGAVIFGLGSAADTADFWWNIAPDYDIKKQSSAGETILQNQIRKATNVLEKETGRNREIIYDEIRLNMLGGKFRKALLRIGVGYILGIAAYNWRSIYNYFYGNKAAKELEEKTKAEDEARKSNIDPAAEAEAERQYQEYTLKYKI